MEKAQTAKQMKEKYDLMERIMLRAPFYLSKLVIPHVKKGVNGREPSEIWHQFTPTFVRRISLYTT